MDFLTYLDLHKNELRNAVLHPLAVAPSNPVEGLVYYNSADKKAYRYNGSSWVSFGEDNVIESVTVNGTALSVSNKTVNVSVPTNTSDLTNDSGFITTNDIPEGAAASTTTPNMDGTAAVGTELAFARGDHVHPSDTAKVSKSGDTMSGDLAMGTNKVTGLGAPTNDTDAATKKYVDDGLSGKLASSLKGANSGLAELDANGKVPSSQLPSYVDDIIDGYYYDSKFYEEAAHTTEITGESGKIYLDVSTNKTYRWSGTAYAPVSESLALGETSSTAYRGDRGKTAYDHSQVTSGNPHNVTASDIGLGSVDNTSDATKKTNFTGAIASGNTGFVTGGDAYTAIAAADKVFLATFNTTVDELAAAYKAHKLIYMNRNGMPFIGARVLDGYSLENEYGVFVIDFISVSPNNDAPHANYYTYSYTYDSGQNIDRWDDNYSVKTLAFADDVDSAVAGLMKSATGTIATNATSATVNYTGTLVNAYATMGGDIVELDKAVTSTSVTFSTAQDPSSAVTCTVIYF